MTARPIWARKAKFILAAVALSLLLSGEAQAVIGWRTATVGATATDTMRTLVANEHYRVCGRSLVYDGQLVTVARWKAQDMGYRGYFAHRSLDGRATWEFYDRAGIPWMHGAGEILAWNNYADGTSAVAAFRGFMRTVSHRAVIRNCSYDRFGVGTFKVASGQKYYVVEFTNVR